MKLIIHILLLTLPIASVSTVQAASTSNVIVRPHLSTDEVENQIELDKKANPLYESKLLAPIQEWKNGAADRTGYNWSLDYNALFMGVSDSLGEDKASSGVVRFFGFWDLVNRDGSNKGSLNWKVENRHSYSDVPPNGLGFESGYVGLFEPVFSDQQTRLTNLYWKQYLAEGEWAFVGGFLDVTDFVDVYLLASPWTGFNNLVFSTGSAATDLPNDATLGIAVGGMVTDKVYIQAGLTDADADPTDPFEGFENVFQESNYFKWIEIGFTPKQDRLYFDNIHVTFWHVDERSNGTLDGWGINASWQQWIENKWLPFVRGSYTENSGSLLERSVTIGLGYQPVPMRGVIGFGMNWGKPNQTTFEGADEQLTAELFWRYQLTKEIAITPTIQYINNPALNPYENSMWSYGLRIRVVM